MITPFRDSQEQAQDIVEDEGKFINIYVKCSVEAAEERDPKRLYEQAREGKIEMFSGINHPFQEPLNLISLLTPRNSLLRGALSMSYINLKNRG